MKHILILLICITAITPQMHAAIGRLTTPEEANKKLVEVNKMIMTQAKKQIDSANQSDQRIGECKDFFKKVTTALESGDTELASKLYVENHEKVDKILQERLKQETENLENANKTRAQIESDFTAFIQSEFTKPEDVKIPDFGENTAMIAENFERAIKLRRSNEMRLAEIHKNLANRTGRMMERSLTGQPPTADDFAQAIGDIMVLSEFVWFERELTKTAIKFNDLLSHQIAEDSYLKNSTAINDPEKYQDERADAYFGF